MLPIVRLIRRNNERRRRNRMLILMRRQLRESYDPFLLPDQRFVELFRLTKPMVQELIELIYPHMQGPNTVRGITTDKKVLVSLRFYATGAYQRSLGEEYNFGMSQSKVHQCIHEVTDVISEYLVEEFIKFPTNMKERNRNKQEFLEKFGFPGVVGAIDGTHVAILKPSEDEQNFLNRKGFHSINCQIICNANMKIVNIFANFRGASHDSFIWNNSQIKVFMENHLEQGEQAWLIGDMGYPQSRVLMIPFLNPIEGTPESRYNNAHIRARNVIERTIGVWKMRFRCILRERIARYDKAFVAKIIKSCAVLHNMCINQNVQIPPEGEVVEDDVDDDNIVIDNRLRNEGVLARQRIVNRYFRN